MKNWAKFIIIMLLSLCLILNGQQVAAQSYPGQLVQQAQRQYQQGKSVFAIKLLNQARRIYQGQNNTLQQAQTLALISLAYQQLGDWESVQQNIDASLTLIDKVPASSSKTQVLAQIGNIKGHYQSATGQYNQALSEWQQAEKLYRQINDRLGTLGTMLDQAEALAKMGFYQRSCDRVLLVFEQPERCQNLNEAQITTILNQVQTQPQPWQINGLNIMGNSLLLMGKLFFAETLVQASFSLESRLPTSSSNNAKILLSLGNVYRAIAIQAKEQENSTGFHSYSQKAIDVYQQLEQQPPTPANNLSQLLGQLNQLSLLIINQQWVPAQTLADKIQLTQDYKRNLYAEVKFANSLSLLKQEQTISYSWYEIADLYLEAINQAQLAGNRRIESYAWGYLGQLCLKQNLQLDHTPQQLLSQALILAQAESAPEMAYQWQWQLGQIYRQQGQKSEAIASYQAALANLNVLRSDLVALEREVQFNFREKIEPVYREFADLLLTDMPSPKQLEMARNVIEALQVAELDNYFQDACLTFEPRSIDQLDPDAAVIYTVILPHRLEVILATSDNQPQPHQVFWHHTQPIAQSELEAQIKQLRLYITEPDRTREIQQLSTQVYDWLIKPLLPELSKKQPKTLVFVLDGILQTIPMAALYDGEHYLIENYAIALTPGLRLINPQTSSRPASLLGGGVSKFLRVDNQEFSALSQVPEELQAFNTFDNQILLNEQFTSVNLAEQLNLTSATMVHLATHGQFRPNPRETFLLMWRQLLTIQQFTTLLQSRPNALANPIDLLVLSACDTAIGDRRAALGLAGVAARSGSLSTLATLWQVNDDSTSELMKHFYQLLASNTKAEALRQAQLKLWSTANKDWQVPAFWSAYVIIGSWQ